MDTPHDIPAAQTDAPAAAIAATDDGAKLVVLNMAASDHPGAPGLAPELADDDIAIAFI